jgi:hypothetical protein
MYTHSRKTRRAFGPGRTTMADTTQLGVKTVQFGQSYREIDGTDVLAPEDMVLLTIIIDGRAVSTIKLGPEAALAAAKAIAQAGGRLIGERLDDNGRRGGLRGYIAATFAPTPTPPADDWYWHFAPGNSQFLLPANREHVTDTPTGAIYRWPTSTTMLMSVAAKCHRTREEAEIAAAAHEHLTNTKETP